MKLFSRIALFFFTVALSMSLQAKNLSNSIQELLSQNSANATVGVIVMDAESGKILYDYQGQRVLTPASNTKLFSAAAALYGLGADYRFITSIKSLQQSPELSELVFEFSGDPALTSADLAMLVHQIAMNGVKRVDGDIVIDDHRFALPDYSAGTSFEDLAYYYAAPVSSVILDGNAVDVTIKPNTELGKPALVSVVDKNKNIEIESTLTTVKADAINEHCDFHAAVTPENKIQLSGCIAAARTEKMALANPKIIVAAMIVDLLQKEGIEWHGNIRFGQVKNTIELAKHESPRVADLVTHTLKVSDNLYADALLKTLGAEKKGVGSYTTGVASLKSVLQENTQIDWSKLQIQDGAGTRFNLMSPINISQLLFAIYHDPRIQPDFFAALPIAGKDGSLKNRFKEMQVREHLWAKTGTMHDISSLSGYVETKKKHMLIFSVIHNNVLGGIKKTKLLEDKIGELLYQQG